MKKTSALILAVSMVCVFIYGTSFAEGFNTDIPVFEDNNKNIPIPTAIAALIPAPDYAKTIAKAKTILNNPGDCSVKEGFKLTNTLFDIAMDDRFTSKQRKEAFNLGKKMNKTMIHMILRP